jgi:hypothetical protein
VQDNSKKVQSEQEEMKLTRAFVWRANQPVGRVPTFKMGKNMQQPNFSTNVAHMGHKKEDIEEFFETKVDLPSYKDECLLTNF